MLPRLLARPALCSRPSLPLPLPRPSPSPTLGLPGRRTFIPEPKADPAVPPTYAQLEAKARVQRLRVIIVSLPLVVVCGYILYRRMVLGEEQRKLQAEGLGGTPPWRVGGPLAGPAPARTAGTGVGEEKRVA